MLRSQKGLLSPWQGLPTPVCCDTAEAAAPSLLRPPPGSWQQRSTTFWWRQDKKYQRTLAAGEIPHGDTAVPCPALRVPNIRLLEGVVPRQWGCLSWAGGWRTCFWELQGSREHARTMQSGSTVSITVLAHAICHSSVGHLGMGGVMTWAGGFSS